MPPKKKTDAASGDGSFNWSPENELKLMSLCFIPRKIGAKEHAEWAAALGMFPSPNILLYPIFLSRPHAH